MALSATVVFEVRQTGSDTNGGGFKTGATGTDWTLQNAAQYSVTDAVTAGTTTITSVTANFGTDVIGNVLYIQGGTGSITAGWYEVTARTDASTITVDRSTGLSAGTGATLNIGGAFATPGQAAVVAAVTGQLIWMKYSATTYDITTSTAGAAGPIALTSGINLSIEGYDVARGDRTSNRPTVKWTASGPGATTYMAVTAGGSATRQNISNIIFDANSVSNVSGVSGAAFCASVIDCIAKNASAASQFGINLSAGGSTFRCQASNCTTGFNVNSGSKAATAIDCDATACTIGFSGGATGGIFIKCLARGGTTGFSVGQGALYSCTADNHSTAGFTVTACAALVACLASNNTGSSKGFNIGTNIATLTNCAVYNNTTNVTVTPLFNEGLITLSGDPYVNQGGADFRPSNTAAGISLRNTGIGVYGQTDNADVGAVQHTDPLAFYAVME